MSPTRHVLMSWMFVKSRVHNTWNTVPDADWSSGRGQYRYPTQYQFSNPSQDTIPDMVLHVDWSSGCGWSRYTNPVPVTWHQMQCWRGYRMWYHTRTGSQVADGTGTLTPYQYPNLAPDKILDVVPDAVKHTHWSSGCRWSSYPNPIPVP